MKISVINGPNLNLLGIREPEIYGTDTLAEIEDELRANVGARAELEFFQSNIEGEIVGKLQSARFADICSGIVLNPGSYSHYSIAIRDAISAIEIPVVEVHLSNIHAREEFRHHTVVGAVCKARIEGMGKLGYLYAVEYLLRILGPGVENG